MVMNKDEAERCLEVSKKKFREGNSSSALKFAKKSLSLHETSEGKDWLSFLESQASGESTTSSTPSSSSSTSGLRNRNTTTSSTTTESSNDNNSTSKPYTKDQIAGIKRIKEFKSKGDLYGVLGLQKDCSDSEIKKAYRKLALQYHPDKCGAPGADDAFKAIGHAFGVLGDADKRTAFDRYGIDSDSRAASAGAAGPQFRGFNGAAFEPDISPEELFRMFMGGDHPGFAFTTGPGFRTHVFTNGRRRTRNPQYQRANVDANLFLQLFQLLPVLLILLMSFLSFWTAEDDPFSFERTRVYQESRQTTKNAVPYFVNPSVFKTKFTTSSQIRELNKRVEKEYHRRLQMFCAQEKDYQRARVQQAYSIFGVNQQRLQEAQNMKLRHCDELHAWK